MPCHHVQTANGSAILCTGGRTPRCCACGAAAPLLCDWKVEGGTCDRPLCASCSHRPAPGKDLCPDHAAEWKARRAAGSPPAKGPTGVITSGYVTRAGVAAYVVAWDDKVSRPMVDVDAPDGLEEGARVVLVGRKLRRRER